MKLWMPKFLKQGTKISGLSLNKRKLMEDPILTTEITEVHGCLLHVWNFTLK